MADDCECETCVAHGPGSCSEEVEALVTKAIAEAKALHQTLDAIRSMRDGGDVPSGQTLDTLTNLVEDIAMHEGLADS